MRAQEKAAAPAPVLVVVGLRAEARIVARVAGAVVVAGGGDAAALARTLEREAPKAAAVLSFGVAGGLCPALRPGALVVAHEVVTPQGERYAAHDGWARALAGALGARPGRIAGVDAAVCGADAKRALRLAHGADLVDMESHVAARAAARLSLPFAAVRAAADPAEREIPRAALVAMRPDGGLALGALMRSLAGDPRQIAGLVRTALDARKAFASLFRGGKMLVPGFLLPDLGELALDMPAEDEFRGPLAV
ncbi:phosphorylase [Methylocella sp.]|uniref:phosphorylase family protein n=1 Tax=Methylocella sp. TaxID=1978226 RepID=UPI0037833958